MPDLDSKKKKKIYLTATLISLLEFEFLINFLIRQHFRPRKPLRQTQLLIAKNN